MYKSKHGIVNNLKGIKYFRIWSPSITFTIWTNHLNEKRILIHLIII